MKRVTVTSIAIIIFLILGTMTAVFYARGYRIIPDKEQTKLEGTGLLVLTSRPDGAKVFVNNEVTTATNNTINLYPGEYEVKITKEGYFSWSKKVIIKKEEVSRADALLVPIAPKLESLTYTGASNPAIDTNGSLIAYTVSSTSAQKNGVYILDMEARSLLNPIGSIRQIANDIMNRFSDSKLEFSPDDEQLIASIPGASSTNFYLLTTKGINTQPQNITLSLDQTKSLWKEQEDIILNKIINDQKKDLAVFIKGNFKDPVFSPEKNKVFYEASTSATIPIIIKPRLIGTNPTFEERELKEGNIYIYDIKEDRNYLIFDQNLNKFNEKPNYVWHPDSGHIIFSEDSKINIMDFDGQNITTIYAGPFLKEFVYPWPDGSGIVILTNLNNQNAPNNLYKIGLK